MQTMMALATGELDKIPTNDLIISMGNLTLVVRFFFGVPQMHKNVH